MSIKVPNNTCWTATYISVDLIGLYFTDKQCLLYSNVHVFYLELELCVKDNGMSPDQTCLNQPLSAPWTEPCLAAFLYLVSSWLLSYTCVACW